MVTVAQVAAFIQLEKIFRFDSEVVFLYLFIKRDSKYFHFPLGNGGGVFFLNYIEY